VSVHHRRYVQPYSYDDELVTSGVDMGESVRWAKNKILERYGFSERATWVLNLSEADWSALVSAPRTLELWANCALRPDDKPSLVFLASMLDVDAVRIVGVQESGLEHRVAVQ